MEMDAKVLDLRLKVLWSGVLSDTPNRLKIEAISPSVCRNAR